MRGWCIQQMLVAFALSAVYRLRTAAARRIAVHPPNETDGAVRIALDRKHRRGKMMTIVSGWPDDEAELAQLCPGS